LPLARAATLAVRAKSVNIESNASFAVNLDNSAVASCPPEVTRDASARSGRSKVFSYRYDANLSCPDLTAHEKQVFRLLCQGLTNVAIAARLGVSPETVKSELKRMFRKIGVVNRTQAAVLMVKQRWL